MSAFARRNPPGIIWIEATIVAKIHITHLGGFMIKLKKLSAIALATVMAASALTGCGSKKDKSTVTTTPTDYPMNSQQQLTQVKKHHLTPKTIPIQRSLSD